MPIEQRFIPFNLLLFFRMRLASLRLGNFRRCITFQPVTILSVSGDNCHVQLIKILNSLLTLSGTLMTSEHSRLEY